MIDEIMRIIAHDVTDRRDLLHLGQTCHTMYEPAMNELWYHLDGLKPLIQCLPDDATAIDTDSKYRHDPIVSTTLDISDKVH